MFLTLALAGGGGRYDPPEVFCDERRTISRIVLKLSIVSRASFAQLLVKNTFSGHVRSRSYDIIIGTTSCMLIG